MPADANCHNVQYVDVLAKSEPKLYHCISVFILGERENCRTVNRLPPPRRTIISRMVVAISCPPDGIVSPLRFYSSAGVVLSDFNDWRYLVSTALLTGVWLSVRSSFACTWPAPFLYCTGLHKTSQWGANWSFLTLQPCTFTAGLGSCI